MPHLTMELLKNGPLSNSISVGMIQNQAMRPVHYLTLFLEISLLSSTFLRQAGNNHRSHYREEDKAFTVTRFVHHFKKLVLGIPSCKQICNPTTKADIKFHISVYKIILLLLH